MEGVTLDELVKSLGGEMFRFSFCDEEDIQITLPLKDGMHLHIDSHEGDVADELAKRAIRTKESLENGTFRPFNLMLIDLIYLTQNTGAQLCVSSKVASLDYAELLGDVVDITVEHQGNLGLAVDVLAEIVFYKEKELK